MHTRDCPQCGKELTYNRKSALTLALKNNRPCTSCSLKNRSKRGIKESTRKKLSDSMTRNRRNGTCVPPEKPFAGHKHTMESRKKISKTIRKTRGLPEQSATFSNKMLITWSKAVRERDDYICQHCHFDGVGNEMEAHHIVPKAKYPQYAYDVENGQTLCKPCHTILHRFLENK